MGLYKINELVANARIKINLFFFIRIFFFFFFTHITLRCNVTLHYLKSKWEKHKYLLVPEAHKSCSPFLAPVCNKQQRICVKSFNFYLEMFSFQLSKTVQGIYDAAVTPQYGHRAEALQRPNMLLFSSSNSLNPVEYKAVKWLFFFSLIPLHW